MVEMNPALNLIQTTKLTYAGETPLTGGKLLNSKAFYGGIGANVQELFSVNEMEQDQTAFFASTTPYETPYGKPEDLPGMLKSAGRDTAASRGSHDGQQWCICSVPSDWS